MCVSLVCVCVCVRYNRNDLKYIIKARHRSPGSNWKVLPSREQFRCFLDLFPHPSHHAVCLIFLTHRIIVGFILNLCTHISDFTHVCCLCGLCGLWGICCLSYLLIWRSVDDSMIVRKHTIFLSIFAPPAPKRTFFLPNWTHGICFFDRIPYESHGCINVFMWTCWNIDECFFNKVCLDPNKQYVMWLNHTMYDLIWPCAIVLSSW